MRRRALLLAAVVGGALMFLLVGAMPAGAVELTNGCEGSGVSLDPDGEEIDEAVAPDNQTGTRDNPFLVDYDGTVEYEGSSPEVFHNHSWHVDVFGITVKDGGSENGSDQPDDSDEVKVDDYLLFEAPGLYHVSGGIEADEGSCDGSMYVKIAGSPIGTIPWIVGMLLTLLGVLGVLTSVPRRVML